MTALSVWWRHRNDPPPMLPDKVTWTADVYPPWVDVNEAIRNNEAQGWTVVHPIHGDDLGRTTVTYRREDGAYRWRDDGMRGY